MAVIRPQQTGLVRIDLRGDKELIEKLERMTRRMQSIALRRAVRAGSTPILRAFRQAAPVGPGSRHRPPGQLRRAQTRKFKTYRNTQTSVAVVGADYKIGPHHHLIEAGTKERYRYKFKDAPGRGYTGKGPALNVFSRAFESVKNEAQDALYATLSEELYLAANG